MTSAVDSAAMASTASNGTIDIKKAMSLDSILAADATSAIQPTIEAPAFAVGSSQDVVDTAATPPTDRDASLDSKADKEVSDPNAPREFECMFTDEACNTKQVTLNLSRKVISNHFGRNKACTRRITEWPLFCRKHYQRATYQPDTWQLRKITLIERQFQTIERTDPGTTYTVSLKKSEMDRLNTFARATDSGLSAPEAGKLVAPNPDVKSFQAPIDVLRELQYELGSGKTYTQVLHILSVIFSMVKKNETQQVPSIEFLPEFPSLKPVKAKAPAAPKKTKTPKAKGTGGRVSSKGAVQKPVAK